MVNLYVIMETSALSPKAFSITKALLEESGGFTLKEIAARLGMAEKTLRVRIPEIRDYLSKHGLSLSSSRGSGSLVVGPIAARLNLLAALQEPNARQFQALQRVHIILFGLLNSDRPFRMHQLEEMLFTSRSSLHKDLRQAKDWLWQYQIDLVSDRKSGIRVLAGEKRFRHALTQLLLEIDDQESKIYPKPLREQLISIQNPKPREAKAIAEFIQAVQAESGMQLIGEEQEHLRLQFLISLLRLGAGKKVSLQSHTFRKILETPWFGMVKRNAGKLARAFSLQLNDEELGYLAGLFISARYVLGETEAQDPLQATAQDITEAYLNKLLKACKISDIQVLRRGLTQHIFEFLKRREFIWASINPVKEQIKREFPKVYQLAEGINTVFQDFNQAEVPDDEVSYITMHILAAVERSKKPLAALFLYENYYSEVKYALAMIENLSNQISFKQVLHYQDLKDALLEETDIVFTTAKGLKLDKPSFLIPILPDSDFLNKLQSEINLVHIEVNQQKIFIL